MCVAGVIGVIGLRLGFIQALLGDASPYPGIGSVEPTGHVVSIIPFVLGLVTIFSWGVKNEPLYIDKEKAAEVDDKEEAFSFEDEDEEPGIDEVEAPEDELDDAPTPEPKVERKPVAPVI